MGGCAGSATVTRKPLRRRSNGGRQSGRTATSYEDIGLLEWKEHRLGLLGLGGLVYWTATHRTRFL